MLTAILKILPNTMSYENVPTFLLAYRARSILASMVLNSIKFPEGDSEKQKRDDKEEGNHLFFILVASSMVSTHVNFHMRDICTKNV